MGSTRERKGKGIITATPKGKDGVDDLTILNPDREIKIAGIKVTVREYRFVEGIEVRARTKIFLDAIYSVMAARNLLLQDIQGLIETHYDLLVPEIALATNLDEEFIYSLSESESASLHLVWWTVNGPFFLARVVNRIIVEREEAKARAGQISLPSSEQADTLQET